jgi:hypothetical protein
MPPGPANTKAAVLGQTEDRPSLIRGYGSFSTVK